MSISGMTLWQMISFSLISFFWQSVYSYPVRHHFHPWISCNPLHLFQGKKRIFCYLIVSAIILLMFLFFVWESKNVVWHDPIWALQVWWPLSFMQSLFEESNMLCVLFMHREKDFNVICFVSKRERERESKDVMWCDASYLDKIFLWCYWRWFSHRMDFVRTSLKYSMNGHKRRRHHTDMLLLLESASGWCSQKQKNWRKWGDVMWEHATR